MSFSLRTVAGSIALLLPLAASAQATRTERPSFSASVTGFQTSVGSNGLHYITATVHFQNKTKKPLILGCEGGKIAASDDQGNRYVFTSLRGVGAVSGSTVDPKFVLPPMSGGDSLFELRTRLDARTVRGITFDLNLTAREILPIEGGQYKLGVEHALEFTGLKTGLFAPVPDNTVDAGPFTAQITRSKVTGTGNERWRKVDMTVRIKNTSDKPLILAYESTSSFGIDDQGNRFGYGVAGTHDTSFSGIGLVTGANADPQLALAPGEAKDVHFSVVRQNSKAVAGTELAYYVALQQLEILPSNQIRSVRQFTLTFPGLSALR